MKLGGTQPTPAPTQAPAAPSNSAPAPTDNAPANDAPSDKPFDDEPFNAGVEADEDSDPKKFIEQLTGKLGQSLRKYNDAQGQPDFELEKFAINSLLAASHTSEMDPNDQQDIIKKVKSAGNDNDDNQDDKQDSSNDSNNNDSNDNGGNNDDGGDLGGDIEADSQGVEENLFEKKEEGFLFKPKKLSIFAPEGSEEAKFKDKIKSKLQETFNQEDMNEPVTEPIVKPAPTKEPVIKPSRKNKPFLPSPNVQPDPKATNE